MDNHKALSGRYCEMCGAEVDRNGDHPNEDCRASAEIATLVRYLADTVYISRIAPAVILMRIVYPAISDREIAKQLRIGKSSVDEVVSRLSTKLTRPIDRVLKGTGYSRARRQQARRSRENGEA
jgi:hypothetical protein